MRSSKEQDPSVPQVYGQSNHAVLCSLMSSVLLRDVGSMRFDRNQMRDVTVNKLRHGLVQYIPHGPYRSSVVLVVLHSKDRDDNFIKSVVRVGTNRGHTIVTMELSSAFSSWNEIRITLSDIHTTGSELFLCSHDTDWLSKVSEPLGGDEGLGFVKGILLFGDELSVMPPTVLQYIAAPTLLLGGSDDTTPDLLNAALRNPFVLVVRVPNLPHDLIVWQSRCVVEFVEAESARRRHHRSKL